MTETAIQRWAMEPSYAQSNCMMTASVALVKHPAGQVVLHSDHLRIVEALEQENTVYKKALEYILILHNLYLGGDFKNEPDGSNGKHLSSIAYQMVDTAEGALESRRSAGPDGEGNEKAGA